MPASNINTLIATLISLGFDPSVESQLRCHLCFKPTQFELSTSLFSGDDVCLFAVRVERGEHGEYQLRYYTASLRKRVEVPAEVAELDRRMAAVDWATVSMGRQVAKPIEAAVVEEAADLVEALQAFGIAADLLRYKYWFGTALEPLIEFSSQHKSIWEISERFYFFNEVDLIPFSDAIRFLNSRWMERQLQLRKKLVERSSEAAGGDSGRSLLLKKKPRTSAKKNLLKK